MVVVVVPRPAIGTTRGVGTETEAGVVVEEEGEGGVVVGHMGVDIRTEVDIMAVVVAAVGTTPRWWPTETPSCQPGGLCHRKAPSR